MLFHKHFLMGLVILLLSFNQQVLSMEDDLSHPSSPARTIGLLSLPLEVQDYILSFLDNQNDLLRAGGTSKKLRQAAERIWNNKPLNLSNRRLNEVDYKALVQGPFSFLVLQSVKLGKEEASILASSSRFIHLDLRSNSIGAEGVGKLASANFPLLTTLYLRSNSIGDVGVGKLASANFPLLTTLDLSYNSIGAEEVGKLASANFPLLTTLYLNFNSIGAKGVGKLASANFPLLTTLDLRYNSIGDVGMEALVKNVRLRVIY